MTPRVVVVVVLLVTAVAAAQPAPDGAGSGADVPQPALPAAPPAPPPSLTRADIDAIVEARLAALPQPPALAAPTPAPGARTAGELAWKDGFWLSGGDGFKLRTGLILQYDGRFFVDDDADKHVDQFIFRSTRLDVSGTVFDHYDFKLMPDFANGKLVVQEAYFDVRYSSVFKLRFGKMKVPFGLERLQEEKATTFTDRGLPTQLAPNRDLGVQAFGDVADGTFAYQLGVFNGIADNGIGDGDVSDDKELAARVFVKPFAKGPELVQELGFGGAVTYGEKHGHLGSPDTPQFKTPAQNTFFQLKTGTTIYDTVFEDGRHWRATGQGYWYTGPFGVLAEYVRSREHVVLGTMHDLADFEAWQVLGQWVVTGDKATYKSVAPRHPFDPAKGQWGAFDVAARVGELRVVDAGTLDNGFADPTKSSRRAWSAGGGVDWFPNKLVRFMLDLDHTWFTRGFSTGDRPAETSIVGRAQIAF